MLQAVNQIFCSQHRLLTGWGKKQRTVPVEKIIIDVDTLFVQWRFRPNCFFCPQAEISARTLNRLTFHRRLKFQPVGRSRYLGPWGMFFGLAVQGRLQGLWYTCFSRGSAACCPESEKKMLGTFSSWGGRVTQTYANRVHMLRLWWGPHPKVMLKNVGNTTSPDPGYN